MPPLADDPETCLEDFLTVRAVHRGYAELASNPNLVPEWATPLASR